jgi:hypothetical protein
LSRGQPALVLALPRIHADGCADRKELLMSEPDSDYERLLRAERELGERHRYVVSPVEETEEAVAAVEDDTPLASLAPEPEPRNETAADR